MHAALLWAGVTVSLTRVDITELQSVVLMLRGGFQFVHQGRSPSSPVSCGWQLAAVERADCKVSSFLQQFQGFLPGLFAFARQAGKSRLQLQQQHLACICRA